MFFRCGYYLLLKHFLRIIKLRWFIIPDPRIIWIDPSWFHDLILSLLWRKYFGLLFKRACFNGLGLNLRIFLVLVVELEAPFLKGLVYVVREIIEEMIGDTWVEGISKSHLYIIHYFTLVRPQVLNFPTWIEAIKNPAIAWLR